MAALEAFLLAVALQVGIELSKEYRKAFLIVCYQVFKRLLCGLTLSWYNNIENCSSQFTARVIAVVGYLL